MQTIAIERVKKGDYFRIPGKKVIYVAKGFEHGNAKWRGTAINTHHVIFLPKGRFVEVNFEF